ncbi:MAG: NAD(P)H-hydrate epimerase, partial [Flammeovirgaceae bacterium]
MQKILDADQIKALDQHTIQQEPIASIDLMERAGRAFFDWFSSRFLPPQKIAVICGTGNNGGDGLAIARMLA